VISLSLAAWTLCTYQTQIGKASIMHFALAFSLYILFLSPVRKRILTSSKQKRKTAAFLTDLGS